VVAGIDDPRGGGVVLAQTSASVWVMLMATVVVGVSAGLGYRGSLQAVNRIAPAQERAAAVSSYLSAASSATPCP